MSSIVILTSEPRDIVAFVVNFFNGRGWRQGWCEVRPANSLLPFLPFCASSEGYFKGVQIVCQFGQVDIGESISSLLVSLRTLMGPPMEAPENSCGAARLQGSACDSLHSDVLRKGLRTQAFWRAVG